jgi:hypothetical protein
MFRSRAAGRLAVAAVIATLAVVFTAGIVAAHEEREVAGYSMEVGLIDEPVFVGQKSGLEFFVNKGETPVEGLEDTLQAQVSYQDQTRDLPLSARFGEPGAYESVFFPTAAGPYTFHIFGTIEDQQIDESFTSSPDGFSEVEELAAGQFPTQFPGEAEIVADAEAGRQAQSQVTIALGAAVVALVVGVIGVGLALGGRRRSS